MMKHFQGSDQGKSVSSSRIGQNIPEKMMNDEPDLVRLSLMEEELTAEARVATS